MRASQVITAQLLLLLSAYAADYRVSETNLTAETRREVKELESQYADYMPRECRKDICLGQSINDPDRGQFDCPDASIGQVVHLTCPYDNTSETNITCNIKNKKASWSTLISTAIKKCPMSYFGQQLDVLAGYLTMNTTNTTLTNAVDRLWTLLVKMKYDVTVRAMRTVSQTTEKTKEIDLDPCTTLKLLEVAEVILVADSDVVFQASGYYKKIVEFVLRANETSLGILCPDTPLYMTITETVHMHDGSRKAFSGPEAIIVEFSAKMEDASVIKDRFCSDGANMVVKGRQVSLLWSTNHTCTLLGDSSQTVRCRCDFYATTGGVGVTTLFITDDAFWRFPHVVELAIVSYILGSISIICLVLTILTFTIFPHLRRERATMILLNLCSSLLLLYVVFMTSTLLTSSYHGCALANILRLYFLLASLIWNGVEGVNMYIKLVRVVGSHISHFVWKAAAVAWGFPVVILGVAFACNIHIFHGEWEKCVYKCRLQRVTMMFVALLPMCIIILTNLVVFSMVLKILAQRSKQLQLDNRRALKVQLVGAVAMLTLLGVPWIFSCLGLVDVSAESSLGAFQLTCQVFFIVFTNLQGTFIFIFHCLRQQEVRMTWKKFAYRHLGKDASYEVQSRLTSSGTNSPHTTKRVATSMFSCSPASSDPGLSTPPLPHRPESDTRY
ncbi:uncharacterized protein LOC135489650 [Lineus longissimus]|uniref:uncharacterized protein LOC135489650 n=1 Tax=Lineus longissimus TaxID=88925 RepID=UPI00315D4345